MKLCWLALLTAALLVASDAVRSAPAGPQPGSPPSGDYIRVEMRGQLRASAASAGKAERFQVSANDVAWELDLAGNNALMQSAQRLDGKRVRAVGAYAERRDAAGARRFLVAETLQPDADKRRDEWIDVTMLGTLKSRVMAIGAETTGVTISANGVVWELELHGKQLETAANLDGRKALVTGRLMRRHGVETGNRFVVNVRSIKGSQ
jgi:hypothetical protein